MHMEFHVWSAWLSWRFIMIPELQVKEIMMAEASSIHTCNIQQQ